MNKARRGKGCIRPGARPGAGQKAGEPKTYLNGQEIRPAPEGIGGEIERGVVQDSLALLVGRLIFAFLIQKYGPSGPVFHANPIRSWPRAARVSLALGLS